MKIAIIPDPGVFRKSGIYVDGEKIRRISHSIVCLKDCLAHLEEEGFFEWLHALEYKGAFAYSIRALSRQMLHSSQLVLKFRRHFVDEMVISQVISALREKGLLSDDEVSTAFSEKWERQGKSRLECYSRCKRLGLPALTRPIDEKKALFQLISKKYSALLDEDLGYKEKSRIIGALTRRGFSYSLVQEVLQEAAAL